MTSTVMRVAVSTQTKITIFFSVGRCVMSVEIRDPTADSVTLPGSPSSVRDGDVELTCVAGEDRVCGSPAPSRHRDATRKVKAARWNVLMVMVMWMVVLVVAMMLEGTRLSCH